MQRSCHECLEPLGIEGSGAWIPFVSSISDDGSRKRIDSDPCDVEPRSCAQYMIACVEDVEYDVMFQFSNCHVLAFSRFRVCISCAGP